MRIPLVSPDATTTVFAFEKSLAICCTAPGVTLETSSTLEAFPIVARLKLTAQGLDVAAVL